MHRIRNRICTALAAGCVGLGLANAAGAVDLRDWGRKLESASERFVVLSQFNNDAVLDKETQLVWRRSGALATTKWASAVHNCQAQGTGGRYGWRLPSLSELSSLTGTGAVLPAGHPFQNVPSNTYFWSTTDHATNSSLAWSKILLGYNYISAKSKDGTETLAYLCVRGIGVEGR